MRLKYKGISFKHMQKGKIYDGDIKGNVVYVKGNGFKYSFKYPTTEKLKSEWQTE